MFVEYSYFMYISRWCKIRFFPQPHVAHKLNVACDLEISSPQGITADGKETTRSKLEGGMWEALVKRDWDAFDEITGNFRNLEIAMDEVSYTLLAHSFLLSHRKASSAALLVVEEMKVADMHPAIIRINERLINSQLELQDMGIRPTSYAWQNLTRLCWMSAARLRNTRLKRVHAKMHALNTDALFQLKSDACAKFIAEEHGEAKKILNDEYLEISTPQKRLHGRKSKSYLAT